MIVERAHGHLLTLAGGDAALPVILEELVTRLVADWAEVTRGLELPAAYDPPAACLVLAKRYGAEWKALRLGDSCLLSREADREHRVHAASPNNAFDHWLSQEARKRRDAGVLDIKALLENSGRSCRRDARSATSLTATASSNAQGPHSPCRSISISALRPIFFCVRMVTTGRRPLWTLR